MKRDWELIKKILIALEEKKTSGETVQPNAIDGYSSENISYHIMLLGQAGLISAYKADYVDGRGEYYYGQNLSWTGHEFIDNAKNQRLWEQVKGIAKDKGIQLSFEAIRKIMTSGLDQLLS